MVAILFGMPSAAAAFVGGGVSRTVQPLQRNSVMTIAAENVAAETVADAAGTFSPRKSQVLRANAQDGPWVEQRARPRRNRKSESVRKMVRETIVTPSNFIYPLFIHDERWRSISNLNPNPTPAPNPTPDANPRHYPEP